jgi:NAD(P)-dependent dehydrogenase (short-subunit alcohol dehydrogenase family)
VTEGLPRVVLVMGASSGIGRATAHLLATKGARLVLAARAESTLEQTRQECIARGAADVVVVPTDVRDAAAVSALFDEAVSRFGRVDAVLQAAGVLAYGLFEDVPADVFDAAVSTNVTGTANMARSALDHFHETGAGSLVVVGSVLSKMATPYMSSYGTSKWAMHGLVRALQIEGRSHPGSPLRRWSRRRRSRVRS